MSQLNFKTLLHLLSPISLELLGIYFA